MSYNIIPFVLVLLSLVVIIVIFIRKFPQLSLLDVESIPEVKEGKKKDEFLKKKIEKKAEITKKDWKKRITPIVQYLKEIQLSFRKYVGRVQREVSQNSGDESMVSLEEKQEQEDNLGKETSSEVGKKKGELKDLIQEGDYALANRDYEIAEKKYIAAIRIDPKNILAYRGLGDVYLHQGQLEEAEETYQFLLQLNATNDNVYMKLGDLAEQKGEIEKAVECYQQAVLINDQISSRFIRLAELLKSIGQHSTAFEAVRQAVELEPDNVDYLDNLADLAIIVGNHKLAEEAYQKLRMINPEDNKLDILKDKIVRLEDRGNRMEEIKFDI